MYGGPITQQQWPNYGSTQTMGYVTTLYVDIPYYPQTAATNWPVLTGPDPREVARKERERRREVAHVPPVVLELCTLPQPEKRLRPQPRGVAWLVRAHGGQRERRALRNSVEKKDAS